MLLQPSGASPLWPRADHILLDISCGVYYLLSVVLNNYVIKQIAVKSIHKLILFIEQNKR